MNQLFAYEATGSNEGLPPDVVVTKNYVTALEAGLNVGRGRGPELISEQLIKDLHSDFTSRGTYLSTYKCDMRRECVLCNEPEFKTKHEYQEGRIDSSCRVIEKCQRCDHEYIGSTKHNWEFSSHKGQDYGTCKRCGKRERKQ